MEEKSNVLISIKDLCKTYKMGSNEVHALDHVNLDIKEHEFVSIIGPSGSRKIYIDEHAWMLRCSNIW